jgi:hypothetical protein
MDQDPSRSIPGNSECSKCQELAEMLASGDVAYEDVLGDPNDSDGEDYQEVPVYQDRAGALRSAIPSVEGECLAPSLLAKLGEVFSTRCPKGGLGVGGDCDVKLLPEGVNSSTSSDNGWAQVESWIEICQRTHAKCRQRVGEDSGLPNKYPTRLLDVGLGSVPEGPVRLIVTEDATPRGDYITLSHCWGTNPVVSLTSDNYDSFMDCIDFCLLPQTFKDVVTITRKLGFQYLWIDSLCINQQGAGAAEDWLRESALMGSVYRNAFLNIGAAGASDARGGCFQEREYGGVLQPVIHKPECPLHFHDFSQPYTLLEENFVEKSLLGEPLLKRGWVFQERFLARRMVYFGSQQLFWHCNESLVCETCPEYMTTPTPLSNLFQIEEVAGSSSDKALVGFMGLHHWHSIVEEYSCKALTRSEDKLVAISGVAQLYHDRALANHDQYCAGVWRSDFPIGLCWKVKRGEGTSPVKYRAPSW